ATAAYPTGRVMRCLNERVRSAALRHANAVAKEQAQLSGAVLLGADHASAGVSTTISVGTATRCGPPCSGVLRRTPLPAGNAGFRRSAATPGLCTGCARC